MTKNKKETKGEMKMNEQEVDIFKRVKVIQFFLFWLTMFVSSFYLLNRKPSFGWIIVLIFIIMFSYVFTAFYFFQLSGYIGQDIGEGLTGFYKKHVERIKIAINIILFILGLILVTGSVIGLIYLFFKIPNYVREGLVQITEIIGGIAVLIAFIIKTITYFKSKEKAK